MTSVDEVYFGTPRRCFDKIESCYESLMGFSSKTQAEQFLQCGMLGKVAAVGECALSTTMHWWVVYAKVTCP